MSTFTVENSKKLFEALYDSYLCIRNDQSIKNNPNVRKFLDTMAELLKYPDNEIKDMKGLQPIRQYEWVLNETDGTLCLSGYPIYIRRTNKKDAPYELCRENWTPWHYDNLSNCKWNGERYAKEQDEFEPPIG